VRCSRLLAAVLSAAVALPAAAQSAARGAPAPAAKSPAARRPAPAPRPTAAPRPAAAAAPAPALPLKYDARPTGAAITAADLMSRVYVFADDSMAGRETGTAGNTRGTAHLAAEARRLGLRPAGDGGTYFQTLPYTQRTVDSASTVRVGGAALAHGADFFAIGYQSARQLAAPVVFGGVIGDSAGLLAPEQAAGKVVVYRVPLTPAALRRMQGASPAAVVFVGLDPFFPVLREQTTGTFLDDSARVGDARRAPPALFATRDAAARFFDAPLDGLAAGAAGRPADLDVRITLAPAAHPARNVVAVLPGSDPALAAQYVAVGAHNDHVGTARRAVDHDSLRLFNRVVRPQGAEDEGKRATPEQQARVNADLAAWRAAHPNSARIDSIFNGADDDASGSMTVLEVAERLAAMKTRPKRSVLFVWHTGEEQGLLGSEWFTDHPTVPRDSIVAQLNIDMVGRGAAADVTGQTKDGALLRGGPNYVQLVGSRRLSTELGDLLEAVNRDNRIGLAFDYSMDANGHPMNIYCRSDHYSYARYGIPVTFFTTGGHADYHQVTDEPQYIDYPHMARVATLVADAAVRVADLDHRVRVDKPKPDPKAQCQQ
jgi:hypothetical protein